MIYDLQKASALKRFSAFLLDIICICIAATLFALLLSIAVDYNGWNNKYQDLKTRYEQKYGINSLSQEEYNALSEQEKKEYNEKNEKARQEAEKALQIAYKNKDPEAVETVKTINMVNNLTLILLSVSIFLAFLVVEFIVPLIFKNGQTIGKKIFSVAVMRTNSTKVNSVVMFIRAMLGQYAIETMIPLYVLLKVFFLGNGGIIDLILIGALLLCQIIVFFASKTFSFIHDLLAATVCVDLSTQLIFDDEEAKIKYIEKIHAEKVKEEAY